MTVNRTTLTPTGDNHGQISPKPAAAIRKHVPQRWRHGDDPDLSRRSRPSRIRFVRPDGHPDGREHLKNYYNRYLQIARQNGSGFILDTPTWRANPDWGTKLGYGSEALDAINRHSVDLLLNLRNAFESAETPCVISGAIGPRGDGYKAGDMNAEEAESYHAVQIGTFAQTEADMVAAYTLTNCNEAIGIARAAKAHAMPCVISFTVETDGRLVTGLALGDAINRVDDATGGAPAYYMINCACDAFHASPGKR